MPGGPIRTFDLKTMKDLPLSRRRFLQSCSLATAMMTFSPHAWSADADSALAIPAFFRPGEPRIPDVWRRRLELPDAKPLVDLLLKTAIERLEDPLPDPQFAKILATP